MAGPLTGPIIAAASSLLGTGASAVAQGKMNKKTLKFNREMYQKQRADALSDWAMTNEYNSPVEQMKRLREAGLNPHLVYGNGVTTTASDPRSSSAPSWSPKAPDFSGVGPVIGTYFDTKMKEAQLNNVQAQTTVATQEAALKAATTASTIAGTAKTEFDTAQAKNLAQVSAETAKANLEKIKTGTALDLQENERKAALNASNLREAIERILNMRAQRANTQAEKEAIYKRIEGLDKDNQLKQLDINLKKEGVQPSDNLFFRVLTQWLKSGRLGSIMDKAPDIGEHGLGKWKFGKE